VSSVVLVYWVTPCSPRHWPAQDESVLTALITELRRLNTRNASPERTPAIAIVRTLLAKPDVPVHHAHRALVKAVG